MSNILQCPFCNSDPEMQEDPTVFVGQVYSNRYPSKVAKQNNGFRIRCVRCGCQTCWWHYKTEAIETWNKRVREKEKTKKEQI